MIDGDMQVTDPMPGCTCGPYWSVVPPGPCPHHSIDRTMCAPPIQNWGCATTTFTLPTSLSDDDIERIVKRVAELLKGGK